MPDFFIVAQFFGLCALLCFIIALQFKNTRKIMLGFVPADLFTALQYVFLGAQTGVVTSTSGAFKNLFIALLPPKFIASILALYLMIIWGIGLYNLDIWYGILPLIGGSATSVAIIINCDNRIIYARSVIICILFSTAYNMIVGAYAGLACNLFIMTSTLIGMARHEKWATGKCYRSFLPSIIRALFVKPQTYP